MERLKDLNNMKDKLHNILITYDHNTNECIDKIIELFKIELTTKLNQEFKRISDSL